MERKYPIGKPNLNDSSPIPDAIATIAALPAQLKDAIRRLGDARMETRYREGGWTARQVIHHLADSHLNSFVRFRVALTEDCPEIKTYNEKSWAELSDARGGPVEDSVLLIEGLHNRWVRLLESMTPADFERNVRHPERGLMSLAQLTRLYAWHCRHHLAHLEIVITAPAA